MSCPSRLSAMYSNGTLAEGLGLIQAASHGLLEDPEVAEMESELKVILHAMITSAGAGFAALPCVSSFVI